MGRLRRTWTGAGIFRTCARRALGISPAALLLMSNPSGSLMKVSAVLPVTFMNVAEAANDDAPIVTFSGLHVYQDGSSTLFVDLTRTTTVQVAHAGREVSFLLSGAKIRYRNNKNPLIAEYFKTNVLRARLVDEPGGVRLIVKLREEVPTDHGMTGSQTGARLRVDIPPPSQR